MIDKNIAKKIVESLEISNEDIVIEIGPGTGSLTDFLVNENCKLILIEIDKRAIEILNSKFSFNSNIHIIEDDFSNVNFLDLAIENGFIGESYDIQSNNMNYEVKRNIKVIGNIPYYLTSVVLFKLFDSSEIIHSSVLTIQKEVAQRLVSQPCYKSYGIISIASNISSEAKILFDVPPSCFYPPPNVNSSVIRHKFQRKFTKFEFDEIMFLVRIAFSQRRKMLRNSLKEYISLRTGNQSESEAINDLIKNYLNKRPEELSYLDFKDLYESINRFQRQDKKR